MNLFKSFINSAVRQVGRDGGKVISNKVYGDSHSTPHRLVKGSGVNTSISGISVEKQYLLTRWIGAFLLCCIPFIGSLIIGYRGVFNILTKYRNGVDHNASYQVQDNRTKSGWGIRYGAAKIKTLKTPLERKFFKIKGIGYLIISTLMIVLFIYTSYYSK